MPTSTTYKDYSTLYNIKKFMAEQVAPKYFQLDNIDETNIGLFGYITEILGTNVEDSFFATTMLFKEIFPVTAEDPESIYAMASLFQMNNYFATPATLEFNILIAEDDVISHATYENGFYRLDIDRDMDINVDGRHFMLDYDIRLMSKETGGNYTHTAYYQFDWNNPISTITSPYIPTRVHVHTENNKRYVLMTVNVHQVTKTTIEDSILSNEKINVVTKEFSFDGKIANFEVYYRESANDNWIQMEKYMSNSTTVSKNPCYYYKFIDDTKFAISFNSNERYFVPALNSELKVEIYTTLGEDGNFDKYNGEELSISGVSTRFSSNKGLIFIGNVSGAALGGYDAKSLDELKNDVIKAYSTVMSFTTANDLTLYFNSLRTNINNELLIIKQRDDAVKRLFSTFVLFKDNDNIVPTNTVNISMAADDFDAEYPQTNRYVLNAGKIYKFKSGSINFVEQDKSLDINSDFDQFEGKEYVYINPFLTVLGTDPTLVGFYINTINDDLTLDFNEVNQDSFNQFIVNSLNIYRNGLGGENTYTITARLYPTSKLPSPAFTKVEEDTLVTDDMVTFINPTDGLEYIDNGVIKAAIVFNNVSGSFIELKLTGFDSEAYIMTATIKTNDYISLENQIQIIEGFTGFNGDPETNPVMIDSYNGSAMLYTFLVYDDSRSSGVHLFSGVPGYENATMTNSYQATENMAFVIPVPEIISTLRYVDLGSGAYSFELYSVPMVKANSMKTTEDFNNFLSSFRSMYGYIQNAVDQLVNNFEIDLKFFNTYGPSRHFYYYTNDPADTGTLMNRVNIAIHFGVKVTINTGVENLIQELKDYIKSYIESSEVSLISAPSLYISNLITDIMNNFQNISYITFNGVDDYDEDVQRFESEVNDINVLEGSFSTADVIPEYLNIDFIQEKSIKTPQIIIDIL